MQSDNDFERELEEEGRKKITKPISFVKVVKPIRFTEPKKVVCPIRFERNDSYKNTDKTENIVAQSIITNKVITANIVPKENANDIHAEEEVANFNVIPYLKVVYINRKGQEEYERELLYCHVIIRGMNKEDLMIRTSEIDKLVQKIRKKYASAQVNYKIPNVEKVIDMTFRELTEKCRVKKCYFEAGWQIINGKHVYLNDNICADDLVVKTNLTLPYYDCSKERIAKIFFDALDIYEDYNVSSTIVMYSFLGVLYRVFKEAGFPPHFLLFLNGKSGSMKTTIAKILYTQLANDEYRDVPRRIDTDTITSFERGIIQSGKDTVTLIDDFSPPKTAKMKSDLAGKLESIVRMVGDGSTKSRSNATLDDCRGEGVQGMVVVTGEIRGKGVSSNLRCLYCQMEREKVNVDKVTFFQTYPYAYTTLIKSFAEYVSLNWDKIKEKIGELFNVERKIIGQVITERRLVDTTVTLCITVEIVREYFDNYCQLWQTEMRYQAEKMRQGIILNALISQSVSKEEEPSVTFIKAIDSLMRIKEIRLTDKSMLLKATTYDGFEDKEYFYFNPQNTHRKVVKYLSLSNNFYPLDLRETLSALYEDKMIKSAPNGYGKRTFCVRVLVGEGKKHSFIKISKDIFYRVIAENTD